MTLALLGHGYAFEMELVVRIFYPHEKIYIVKDDNFTINNGFTHDNLILTSVRHRGLEKLSLCAEIFLDGERLAASDEIRKPEDAERRLGLLLFGLMRKKTGKEPVWGMLTGIRPVRMCGRWRESGAGDAEILRRLRGDYLVSEEKAGLCLGVLDRQKEILTKNRPGTFSLYVSIPFCPTRCRYCSFVSHAIDRAGKLLPEYLLRLCEEIRLIGRLAREKGLRLLTVYIGGGTPAVLKAEQLKCLLGEINECFDISQLLEYTVEAGRADVITREKLAAVKEAGADRVSINPQSMTPRVLEAIGRRHTEEQVIHSFELAREIGFKSINADIITGLPQETPESFAESLEKLMKLSPENVTVHALTNKRSSEMREDPAEENPHAAQMQRYAAQRLESGGYAPYYLYRQKPAVENLENTGYAKPGYEAAYNVYSMDDAHNILAAGAGAVSKLVLRDGNLKRIFNHKYPYEYIGRFGEILDRKGEIPDLWY